MSARDVTPDRGVFDRFAEAATNFVSRAPYFAACLITVLVWAGSGPLFHFGQGWHLIINTGTTTITFLMGALLKNSTRRSDQAIQHKLNAIAQGMANLMAVQDSGRLADEIAELMAAVGLEHRESTN